MPLKSTQTNKYETACFVQEAPVSSEMATGGYEIKKSIATGGIYVVFPATLQTYGCQNRMGRRYDMRNVQEVVDSDERIRILESQNKWRGEWNHPNPDIKGEQLTDIRMTIPEPTRTSHMISKHQFVNNRMKATITTDPGTECGRAVTSEIVDLGVVPSFSVRILGNMIPNAPAHLPNMRVTKMITADMVDFPSHHDANADIIARIQESANVVFLKELSRYCVEQDENMRVVCESFAISTDEIMGIHNGNIIIEQADTTMHIPLKGDIRREAMSILLGRGLK